MHNPLDSIASLGSDVSSGDLQALASNYSCYLHGKKVARYGKNPLSLSLRRHSHGLASLSLNAESKALTASPAMPFCSSISSKGLPQLPPVLLAGDQLRRRLCAPAAGAASLLCHYPAATQALAAAAQVAPFCSITYLRLQPHIRLRQTDQP